MSSFFLTIDYDLKKVKGVPCTVQALFSGFEIWVPADYRVCHTAQYRTIRHFTTQQSDPGNMIRVFWRHGKKTRTKTKTQTETKTFREHLQMLILEKL